MARYDLSEAEWRVVEPLLPPVGKGAHREGNYPVDVPRTRCRIPLPRDAVASQPSEFPEISPARRAGYDRCRENRTTRLRLPLRCGR